MDFSKTQRAITAEIKAVLDAVDGKQAARFAGKALAARAVFTAGEGRSGLVARAFAMRLAHIGISAHVVGETTTPPIGAGDLLVAVSGSGETGLTLHVAESAGEAGADLAAVVADENSALAALAEVLLVIPGKVKTGKGLDSAQMPGSLFEQAAFIALDAVVSMMAAESGASHEDMRGRHANLE